MGGGVVNVFPYTTFPARTEIDTNNIVDGQILNFSLFYLYFLFYNRLKKKNNNNNLIKS